MVRVDNRVWCIADISSTISAMAANTCSDVFSSAVWHVGSTVNWLGIVLDGSVLRQRYLVAETSTW